MTLERKTREAEILTARLVEESERRAAEANKLKEELLRARAAEKQAKEKLLDFLSRSTSYNTSVTASPISVRASIWFILFFYSLFFQSVTNLYTGPLSPQYGADLSVLEPETSVSPDLNLNLNSYDLIAHADADQLSLEIEKERLLLILCVLFIFFCIDIVFQGGLFGEIETFTTSTTRITFRNCCFKSR